MIVGGGESTSCFKQGHFWDFRLKKTAQNKVTSGIQKSHKRAVQAQNSAKQCKPATKKHKTIFGADASLRADAIFRIAFALMRNSKKHGRTKQHETRAPAKMRHESAGGHGGGKVDLRCRSRVSQGV